MRYALTVAVLLIANLAWWFSYHRWLEPRVPGLAVESWGGSG